MRQLLLSFLLPLAVALPFTVQKPAAKADAPPTVTAQMLQPLESVAHQLAKGGREKELKDLLAALQRLGYPSASHEKLEKSCMGELAKAKTVADSLPQGAKTLRTVAKQLYGVMQKLEGEEKEALARKILLLDGNMEEVHTDLGHTKVGTNWVPPEMVPIRERRAVIFQKLQEAKKLDVEIETGEVEDPLILRASGIQATFARYGNYELRSNFSPEKTERILRETLRAWSVSNWMRKGGDELKLPPRPSGVSLGKQVYVLLGSREQFKKLAAECAAAKEMPEDEARIIDNVGSFNHLPTSTFVMLAQVEGATQAQLLISFCRMPDGVPTALSAGHLNWISLACFGELLPGLVFKSEKVARFEQTRVETEEQKREREERLKLAKAGIAGSRAWMAYLAERGEDPAFGQSISADKLGMIRGDDLHKCTSIVEYIQELDIFGNTLKLLSKKASGKLSEQYAGALNMPLADLEEGWRKWLLGSRQGIAERIDKRNANAWPADALAVLEYMNEIREVAFKGKVEGVWKLRFDPELSEQCALHAHYLTLHPEQQKWPDAHEEYADKEGFTVEGQWAGTHSVIAWGDLEDYKEGVDLWMGSFYHRLPLTDPGVLRLGWGQEGIYMVMDMSSLAAPYDKPYTVLWPADGQKDVPTAFAGDELPNPVPEIENEAEVLGYPITIQTNPVNDKGETVDIVMKLFDGKNEVPCWFSSPTKPSNPELAPSGAWCLIPKAPLKLKTEYKVWSEWRLGGDRVTTSAASILEWTFKTN